MSSDADVAVAVLIPVVAEAAILYVPVSRLEVLQAGFRPCVLYPVLQELVRVCSLAGHGHLQDQRRRERGDAGGGRVCVIDLGHQL